MRKHLFHQSGKYLPVIAAALLTSSVTAADLDQVQAVGEKKLVEAEKSQKKIDKVVDGSQARLIKYRSLQKQIEGLKAYNDQLSTQVKSQDNLIERFNESITQVALIERQMSPLVSKMTDSLAAFIELDLPFHMEERQERIAFIRESITAADIDVAEKFRQIMEAYQIENEYGRKVDSYQDIVTIEGAEHEVDVLRVGRIALVCQTKDTRLSAVWDNDQQTWQRLDNSTYRNSIRDGIKMAKKQASINVLTLPIAAPEVAK